LNEFDSSKFCRRCDALLLSVSDICPQCGCSKIPLLTDENTENEIEDILDSKEPIEFKFENKISHPTGVRMMTIFEMLCGVFLVISGILFGVSVILLVMSSGLSSLAGIGNVGNMPMPLGMGGDIDPMTMSVIDVIIGLHSIVGFSSVSEIQNMLSSSGVLNVQVIMDIITDASIIVIVEIILGISALIVGRSLFKGKNWARLITIISAIVSIPLVVIFLENIDNRILLGMIVFDCLILYYLMKPKVREYFSNSSKNMQKKSNVKT